MRTEYLTLDGSANDAAKIAHAARLLQAGALVAFPTETVYGLGVDARNPEALARLTQVKGRREGKPYSLLVPSLRHAEEAAGGFSRIAQKLARLYWPGPLTLVVPRREGGNIGLRLPEHPVARSLLAHCGFSLATPSANRSGAQEPLTAHQVREALDGDISLILDGGPAWQGKASAVVKVEGERIEIQREGTIPNSELLEYSLPTIMFVCTGNTCRSPMASGFCQYLMEAANGAFGENSETRNYRIYSAGTSANEGERAEILAIEAMKELGIDISRHRTRSLSMNLLDRADWIFTMTRAHRDSILALVPTCEPRVQLLSRRGEEIPDPVSRALESYRQVRDKIGSCLRDVVRLVAGSRH